MLHKYYISFCKILIFLIPFILLIQIVVSHPHPIYSLTANNTNIKIHSFHAQKVSEDYIKNNLILKDCNLYNLEQDENSLNYLETVVVMKHDCKKPIILKNTLFVDYWKKVPITKYIKGFDTEDKSKTIKSNNSFFSFKLTGNFFYDLILILIFGILSSFFGDLFSFIIPVSIGAKANKNKKFLIYSILIHLGSTYIFTIFSLYFFSSIINKYIWLILIIVGLLFLLENYLKKKHISPYFVSLIPCPATIFVVNIFLKESILLSIIAPLIIIGSEFIILILIKKAFNKIKFRQKYQKIVPYLFILLGIILFIKYVLMVPDLGTENKKLELNKEEIVLNYQNCQFNETNIKEYIMKLEFQLRTTNSCEDIIKYINSHTCTSNASIEIGDNRFFFNLLWHQTKNFSYSYEKESLTHLDCNDEKSNIKIK
jgi:hypothetical protein